MNRKCFHPKSRFEKKIAKCFVKQYEFTSGIRLIGGIYTLHSNIVNCARHQNYVLFFSSCYDVKFFNELPNEITNSQKACVDLMRADAL